MKEGKSYMKAILLVFLKKKCCFGQMGYYGTNSGPKMTDLCNFRSALKIYLKFSTEKVDKRYMKTLYCRFFQKKSYLGAN